MKMLLGMWMHCASKSSSWRWALYYYLVKKEPLAAPLLLSLRLKFLLPSLNSSLHPARNSSSPFLGWKYCFWVFLYSRLRPFLKNSNLLDRRNTQGRIHLCKYYQIENCLISFIPSLIAFLMGWKDELARLRRQSISRIPTVRSSGSRREGVISEDSPSSSQDGLDAPICATGGSFLQFAKAVLSPTVLNKKVNTFFQVNLD